MADSGWEEVCLRDRQVSFPPSSSTSEKCLSLRWTDANQYTKYCVTCFSSGLGNVIGPTVSLNRQDLSFRCVTQKTGGNLDGSVVRQNTELCGCAGKGKQVFSGVCQGCLVRNLLSRDASKPAPSRAPETAEDGKNQGVNQGQRVDSAFFLRVFAKPLWSLLYFPTSHLFKTGAGYFPCRLQSSCSLKNNPCCFKMCRRRTRPQPGCSREALTDPVSSFEVLWSKAMESIFLAGRHLQCGHFKDGIGTWTSCQPQMCDHQATGLIQSYSFDVSSKCQHLYRQTHRQVD
ncbi:uncharacterized protein LOC121092583 [Falco naumanni]|uniref:uncharacterized protein LOC121092583 n=1 Tax=Falco naumanni TaxID=148594 RepID=UPI001ADE9B70|nr:uncharacterized protein LOC121092583 [Falco naumanni]